MRTNKHQYFLDIAKRCAEQGTCLRRNFGAVIVDSEGTIISTGYTGAPSKMEDCLSIKKCWRKDNNIKSGTNYEKCRSVHAEMNALIQAGKLARNADLYLYGFDYETGQPVNILPCFLCIKMIINAGIKNIIMKEGEVIVTHIPDEIYDERSEEAFGN
jgi:dCMP deaminase